MLRRVASRVLSCSGKSAAVTTFENTPPGRFPGRAVVGWSLPGCDLEPVQGRLVIGDRKFQCGGAVGVTVLLGLLGLFACHRQSLGVILVGAGVQRLQL